MPAPLAADVDHTVPTTGRWFGSGERPSIGWLSHAPNGVGTSGVLVLPPVAYPYWCSHRTLRVLAERLAANGHAVFRIDYDGTGDSAGDQSDRERVTMWRDTVRAAADELRQIGCRRITLIGARIGATFALLEGARVGAERVVAWAPIESGRRFVKELRLLSIPAPDDEPATPADAIVSAGSVFSVETLTELSALSLTEISAPPASEILLVDDPSGSTAALAGALRERSCSVTELHLRGGELALETPPELGDVPEPIVDAITTWVGPAPDDRHPAPGLRTTATFAWNGAKLVEQVVAVGPHHHVGVISGPPAPDPSRATIVFLNPGSETHVGPGRAWVELARELAIRGHRTARIDFRGWGESPDDGRAPGRPYDACGVGDATEIAAALQEIGHPRIVLFGLCASAWIALRTVLTAPVAGVIALNPQMYWSQGDPVEIDWDVIRAQRASEIRRIDRGARTGLWTVLDLVGQHGRAGAWLDQLARCGRPVHLLFTDGDDGLVFLRQRHARRLARLQHDGTIRVRELPEVDHPLHRAWLRRAVAEALHEELGLIDAGSGAAEDPART